MLAIRRAEPPEAATLLELICALADYEKLPPPDEAAKQRLVRDIFGPKPRLDAYLAFYEGRAVGYALILETYSSFLALPTLYLEDIFVLPDCRGKGVGAELLREMVAEAERRGCGRMEWVVLDWNTTAQEFYKRFGATHLNEWMTMRLTKDDFIRILKQ